LIFILEKTSSNLNWYRNPMKIIKSPHPPTPSPKLGRRGVGARVSFSLSHTWERAGVRAFNDFRVYQHPRKHSSLFRKAVKFDA
jgi:hypothetical protein